MLSLIELIQRGNEIESKQQSPTDTTTPTTNNTNKEIKDHLVYFNGLCKKELTNISNNSYREIMSIDTDKLYKNKKKFNKLCTLIVMVYAARQVLYGLPIPIILHEYMSDDMKKSLAEL